MKPKVTDFSQLDYGYGDYPGAGWVHYNCGQAVNAPEGGLDASEYPLADPGMC